MKTLLVFSLFLSSFFVQAQDVIIFRNGSQQTAKVLEVGSNSVVYKKSDNLDGPNYVANTSEVNMIIYANGSRDVMANSNTNVAPSPTPQNYPSYSSPAPVQPRVNVVVAPPVYYGGWAWGGYRRPYVGMNYYGGYGHHGHHRGW
jgi:hypothetical protein